MIGSRRLGLGALTLFLLAGEVAPLWANTPPPLPVFRPDPVPKPEPIPQPDPIPKPDPLFFDPTPNPAPNPVPNPIPSPRPNPEPRRDDPPFVKPPPPKRTGPFRSCGSGAGTGLAGIGVASALLWLGNRFAARINRKSDK